MSDALWSEVIRLRERLDTIEREYSHGSHGHDYGDLYAPFDIVGSVQPLLTAAAEAAAAAEALAAQAAAEAETEAAATAAAAAAEAAGEAHEEVIEAIIEGGEGGEDTAPDRSHPLGRRLGND